MSFAVPQHSHDNEICNNPAALTINHINPVVFALISWEQIHQPFEENFRGSKLLFPPLESAAWQTCMRRTPPASLNLRLATCLKWLGVCQRHGVPAGVRPASAFVGVRCAQRGHGVPSVHQTSSQQIDGFCWDTSEHVLFSQCPPLCKYEVLKPDFSPSNSCR